jgi:hypothetical protein
VVILGLPYTGKTTEARRLITDAPRVIAFDPGGDYSAQLEPLELGELLERPEILARPHVRIAIQPAAGDAPELAQELASVERLARAARNLVLVLDEVGDYSRSAGATLERLARNGRHQGLVSIYVSQCAVDIPRTVRRLATRVISFRQEDPDDLEILRERYGDPFAQRAARWQRGQPPATWVLPTLERHAQ